MNPGDVVVGISESQNPKPIAPVDGQALGENFQSLEDIRQKASTLAKTLERLIGRAYRPPNSAHTLSRPIRCSHAAYCLTSGLA